MGTTLQVEMRTVLDVVEIETLPIAKAALTFSMQRVDAPTL